MNKIEVKWNDTIVGYVDTNTNEIKFLDNDQAKKAMDIIKSEQKIYLSSRQKNSEQEFTYATTAELMLELGKTTDEALDIHNELNNIINDQGGTNNQTGT